MLNFKKKLSISLKNKNGIPLRSTSPKKLFSRWLIFSPHSTKPRTVTGMQTKEEICKPRKLGFSCNIPKSKCYAYLMHIAIYSS